MKTIKKVSQVALIPLLLGIGATPGLAGEGGTSIGGGGGASVAEFYDIAREIELKWQGSEKIELEQKIKKTKVRATNDELFENGEPVNAKNFPNSKLILFNLTAWQGFEYYQKVQLVGHEFLGISKVPDLAYETSNAIVDQVKFADEITAGGVFASYNYYCAIRLSVQWLGAGKYTALFTYVKNPNVDDGCKVAGGWHKYGSCSGKKCLGFIGSQLRYYDVKFLNSEAFQYLEQNEEVMGTYYRVH